MCNCVKCFNKPREPFKETKLYVQKYENKTGRRRSVEEQAIEKIFIDLQKQVDDLKKVVFK